MPTEDNAPAELPDTALDPSVPSASSDSLSAPPVYTIRPRLRSILLAFLVHHNPFYLLSALCMIAGCYTLNGALGLRTGEVDRVLLLIGTISLYELMLVALGLFLIRRRGIIRDGRTLLLLQIVFLVDLTFLNAETVTVDLHVGLAVNGALLLLALAKVGAVMWVLTPRFPWRQYAMAALMLAGLFGLPCLFRMTEKDGRIDGTSFAMAWWCAGLLLPIVCEALRFARRSPQATVAVMRPRLGGLYVAMGYVSLIAHLAMMHWVYRGPFYIGDLSPVLLGLAVAAAYGEPTRLISRGDLRFARLMLPVAAVLCAIVRPRPLDLTIGGGGRLALESIHLALAGAYVVYIYAYLWRWLKQVAAFTAGATAFALFGPTAAQLRAWWELAGEKLAELAWAIVPKTMVQWGVTAVGAAFAFLGIGAWVSLSQGKRPDDSSKPITTAEPSE